VLLELLGATVPAARSGESVFKPVWVHEAMNRAELMVRLVTLGDEGSASGTWPWAMPVAQRISTTLQKLAGLRDEDLTLCRANVCELAEGVFDLFSPRLSVGRFDLRITNAVMPAYRTRATALIVVNFMLGRLYEAMATPCEFNFCVTLERDSVNMLRLRASIPPLSPPGPATETLRDLAGLLNGRLSFATTPPERAYTEISFMPFV
jgi:hypothetical protein